MILVSIFQIQKSTTQFCTCVSFFLVWFLESVRSCILRPFLKPVWDWSSSFVHHVSPPFVNISLIKYLSIIPRELLQSLLSLFLYIMGTPIFQFCGNIPSPDALLHISDIPFRLFFPALSQLECYVWQRHIFKRLNSFFNFFCSHDTSCSLAFSGVYSIKSYYYVILSV